LLFAYINKGNLFPQTSAKVINFFEKINENAEESNPNERRQLSIPSLVLTPSSKNLPLQGSLLAF